MVIFENEKRIGGHDDAACKLVSILKTEGGDVEGMVVLVKFNASRQPPRHRPGPSLVLCS